MKRNAPDRWRTVLTAAEQARLEGLPVTAQVCGRPIGLLAGLELSVNPFTYCAAYQEIADLPFEERLKELRHPARRARIVADYPCVTEEPVSAILAASEFIFELTDELDYEPQASASMAMQALSRGVSSAEHMYDLMTAEDGRHIFYIPAANFVDNRIDAVQAMMRSDVTVPGLGDGGAHCGLICDASLPTYNLLRWTGDPAGRLSLPGMVRSLTLDCARAVDLNDRGLIAPGWRADLNIIDLEAPALQRPHMVYDLPTGGGRLTQSAKGYVATIVSGEVTYRNGVATGKLPGRLVRDTVPAPLPAGVSS